MTDLQYSLSPPLAAGKLPTRVYISGAEYRIVAPKGVLPGLPGLAKLVMNWIGPAGRVAKNILHAFMGSAVDMSNTANLQALANNLMTTFGSSGLQSSITHNWTLSSVTARDASGTSSNAVTSTNSPLTGTDVDDGFPPGTAVVISWASAITARGGRARTYLPGVPQTCVSAAGNSQLSTTFANSLKSQAETWRTSFNSTTTGLAGGAETLGTVSYYAGHAILATPIWRPFTGARVHERIDSQRRRNGKETLFPLA